MAERTVVLPFRVLSRRCERDDSHVATQIAAAVDGEFPHDLLGEVVALGVGHEDDLLSLHQPVADNRVEVVDVLGCRLVGAEAVVDFLPDRLPEILRVGRAEGTEPTKGLQAVLEGGGHAAEHVHGLGPDQAQEVREPQEAEGPQEGNAGASLHGRTQGPDPRGIPEELHPHALHAAGHGCFDLGPQEFLVGECLGGVRPDAIYETTIVSAAVDTTEPLSADVPLAGPTLASTLPASTWASR